MSRRVQNGTIWLAHPSVARWLKFQAAVGPPWRWVPVYVDLSSGRLGCLGQNAFNQLPSFRLVEKPLVLVPQEKTHPNQP